MSSTSKTSMGLNLWQGGDKPKRSDFNRDNMLIDSAFSTHSSDSSHITAEEREKWNNNVYVGAYFGDGQTSRTVNMDVPFTPSAVVVFADSVTPTVLQSDRECIYLAYATQNGSTLGVELKNSYKSLAVVQSTVPVLENQYLCLNESGTSYCYICFR